MKLIKKMKKGFTLVELVVVIAIIAILAGVSVGVYVGITNSAKKAADSEIITQLNTKLRADNILEGRNYTAMQAFEDAEEIGFNLAKMTPQYGDHYVWDEEHDLFAVTKGSKQENNEEIVYQDSTTELTSKEWKKWIFTAEPSQTEDRSQFFTGEGALQEGGDGFKVHSGFDAGKGSVAKLIYENNTSPITEKEVVIRTNGETAIKFDASKDTVKLYGLAGDVTVTHIANSSLHVYGTVSYVDLKDGHMVVEDGGYVAAAYKETATATAETEGTGKIGHAHASEAATAVNDDAKTSTAYNVVFDYDGVNKTAEGGKDHSDKDAGNPTTVAELKNEFQTDPDINKKLSEIVSSRSEEYVARIKDNGYKTLPEAFKAWINDDVIYLLKDLSTDTKGDFYGSGILNGDGHSISSTYLTTNGVAEYCQSAFIFDGPTEGAISNTKIIGENGTGLYAADGYTLTINDCVIIAKNNQESDESNCNTHNGPYDAAIRITENSIVTVNSGTYTGYYAFRIDISGGTINITGGTFNGYLNVDENMTAGEYATVNISGGTFNGEIKFDCPAQQNIAITGGTFDHDPSAYVATGYEAVKTGSVWVVSEK